MCIRDRANEIKIKHLSDQQSPTKNEIQNVNKGETKKPSNERRKKDHQNEVTRKQKLVQELPITEQKILEGLDKYVACNRRAATNYFSCRDKWYSWTCENTKNNAITSFGNLIIVKKNFLDIHSFHLTEDKDFPIREIDMEIFMPIISKGCWLSLIHI